MRSQTATRETQITAQGVGKWKHRNADQGAENRIAETGNAPIAAHECGQPLKGEPGGSYGLAMPSGGLVELAPAFKALDNARAKRSGGKKGQGNRAGIFVAGLSQDTEHR